jgi:hypothetical protein
VVHNDAAAGSHRLTSISIPRLIVIGRLLFLQRNDITAAEIFFGADVLFARIAAFLRRVIAKSAKPHDQHRLGGRLVLRLAHLFRMLLGFNRAR